MTLKAGDSGTARMVALVFEANSLVHFTQSPKGQHSQPPTESRQWWGGWDLNPRSLVPETSILSGTVPWDKHL